MGEHLPCKQGVMSSNLTISTRSSMKIEDAGRHLNKYLDNRIRKYMNCRNTMHENIKKAALNDRKMFSEENIDIYYSANSKQCSKEIVLKNIKLLSSSMNRHTG